MLHVTWLSRYDKNYAGGYVDSLYGNLRVDYASHYYPIREIQLLVLCILIGDLNMNLGSRCIMNRAQMWNIFSMKALERSLFIIGHLQTIPVSNYRPCEQDIQWIYLDNFGWNQNTLTLLSLWNGFHGDCHKRLSVVIINTPYPNTSCLRRQISLSGLQQLSSCCHTITATTTASSHSNEPDNATSTRQWLRKKVRVTKVTREMLLTLVLNVLFSLTHNRFATRYPIRIFQHFSRITGFDWNAYHMLVDCSFVRLAQLPLIRDWLPWTTRHYQFAPTTS